MNKQVKYVFNKDKRRNTEIIYDELYTIRYFGDLVLSTTLTEHEVAVGLARLILFRRAVAKNYRYFIKL